MKSLNHPPANFIVPETPLEPTGDLVSVRDVTMRFPIAKRYRELIAHPLRPRRLFQALTSVNLEIQKGDRIAVLGPNGAGKTTLLKLIGGLLLPTEGQIMVNGYDTLRHNDAARKSVGFVLNEERSFYWRLSGMQNLEFFGALDNLGGKELRDRTKQLVHFVGLEDHIDMPVSTYSCGMRQRLALARGLISEPGVLILDEPTRTLDPVACDELIQLILERLHKDSRKTLLIATHRLDEVRKLCDKIVVINNGRIVACDQVSDLTTQGVALLDYYRRAVAEVPS